MNFFKKILNNLLFLEYYTIIPILISMYFIWLVFLKLNITNNEFYLGFGFSNSSKVDSIKNNNTNIFYINYFILFILYGFFYTHFLKGFEFNFFFDHFLYSNYSLKLFIFFIFMQFLIYFFLNSFKFSKINYTTDYYFSLILLLYLLPFLFFLQNMFIFIFFIELISCTIFYKLIASRLWYKDIGNIKNKTSEKNNISRFLPKHYVNMVFFQYWVTFFSTIVLLYSLINLYLIFGSSNWGFLNYLSLVDSDLNVFFENQSIKTSSNLILLGFLIKMGIAPLHLFKIEVYKGIPFLSIFFYTTYYFLIYLVFLYILINLYLTGFAKHWIFYFKLTLVFGFFYITNLFFSVSFVKAFFAYSTIINTLSFLLVLVSNFF